MLKTPNIYLTKISARTVCGSPQVIEQQKADIMAMAGYSSISGCSHAT